MPPLIAPGTMHLPDRLLEILRQRPNHGLALIGNIEHLGTTEISLAPGTCIRRATPEEAEHLWKALLSLRPGDLVTNRNPFETKIVQKSLRIEDKLVKINDVASLDASLHRYHLLEYPELSSTEHLLENASILTTAHLFVLYGVTATLDKNQDWGPTRHVSRFFAETDRSDLYFVETTDAWIEDLRVVYSKLSTYDNSLIPLAETLDEYRALQTIEEHPRMLFLGLFTLLEKLLTHKPNPEDRYDSITRQIRTKMTLLAARFRNSLEYSGVGTIGDLGENHLKNLWNDLYSLRSAIAHGDSPDFKKELKRLGDLTKAESFLRGALRAVMRQALDEPRLLADLRNC